MSIRGILRGFGLKVGPTTRRTYAARIRELIEGHPTLEAIAASLLKVRDALADEFAGFERKLRAMARQDDNARRLMTTRSVGVLVALTFVSAVDAPERFRSSRAVGPHFGLTPKKYQSGETDYTGRISKIGDVVRTALYEAANVILTRRVKGSDLKSWALAVARRAGPRKARVALGRKLAVVLHYMLRDGTNFIPHRVAATTA
ncbi:transposase [Rhizobium mongolense]